MPDKRCVEKLAIMGGTPSFAEPLHVGRPNIGNSKRLLDRISDTLDRRWLTNNGPNVQELEREISNLLGVQHCVATGNGTVALEIAIRAAGVTGEVIVPSWTFIATAHALRWQGITPVFCDVHPATHNLDPDRVEQMLTPRTTGIIGVHLWGRACDVNALADIAGRHNLKLIFDAAHAFGCSYKGRMIGGFGDAEVFSFHAAKFFNTFEGGAVTTNNDELAAKIRLMRNFGFEGYDQVSLIGTNGKMNEISAAMGLTSLESMEEFIAVNRRNYQKYREELRSVPGIHLLPYDEMQHCNYQYVILDIESSLAGLDRDELMQILWAENVHARRYFYPGCHRMEPYRSDDPGAGLMLPNTERVAERVLSLPTGTAVGVNEITTISSIIRTAVSRSAVIRRHLSGASPIQPAAVRPLL